MKRNYLQAAVVSGLLCLSGAVFAETQDVFFDGDVSAACSFDGAAAEGTLDLRADGKQLSSEEGVGTRGEVVVTCTGAGTIGVMMPLGVTSVPAETAKASALHATETGAAIAQSSGGPATIAGAVSAQKYYVSMGVDSSSLIPAGTYRYKVVVSVAAD